MSGPLQHHQLYALQEDIRAIYLRIDDIELGDVDDGLANRLDEIAASLAEISRKLGDHAHALLMDEKAKQVKEEM